MSQHLTMHVPQEAQYSLQNQIVLLRSVCVHQWFRIRLWDIAPLRTLVHCQCGEIEMTLKSLFNSLKHPRLWTLKHCICWSLKEFVLFLWNINFHLLVVCTPWAIKIMQHINLNQIVSCRLILFRVRSWNKGMSCISCYVPLKVYFEGSLR